MCHVLEKVVAVEIHLQNPQLKISHLRWHALHQPSVKLRTNTFWLKNIWKCDVHRKKKSSRKLHKKDWLLLFQEFRQFGISPLKWQQNDSRVSKIGVEDEWRWCLYIMSTLQHQNLNNRKLYSNNLGKVTLKSKYTT